jgi:inosose dehydratase
VIEAEQDPAKAHPLTYVTKGRQHLSALVTDHYL